MCFISYLMIKFPRRIKDIHGNNIHYEIIRFLRDHNIERDFI